MNRYFKNLFFILLLLFMATKCHALDLDETVDDEIRKNYNPTKLINDVGIKDSALEKNIQSEALPELPNITKYENDSKPQVQTQIQQPKITYKKENITIKDGTSFNVKNITAISDWQTKGTQLKFKTVAPIYKKNYTIPEDTIFKGEIVESHQPQISCNGGLVSIKIYSMQYKGETIPINAYITRANDKKIFFNNIKGERTYLKTLWKKGNWGRTLFDKMLTLTVSLGSSGSTLILSPFPLAYGSVCLGLNTITAPICTFFEKGKHISIPAESNFRIKLLEDVFI